MEKIAIERRSQAAGRRFGDISVEQYEALMAQIGPRAEEILDKETRDMESRAPAGFMDALLAQAEEDDRLDREDVEAAEIVDAWFERSSLSARHIVAAFQGLRIQAEDLHGE